MAHYAEVINNTVVRVVAVSNDVTTVNGVESEQAGIDHLDAILPTDGEWMQTSYSGTIRYNFAGIGHTYDADADAFYGPQPHPSWALDDNYEWMPPIPYPFDPTTDPTAVSVRMGVVDGVLVAYDWDEDTTSWVEVTE
jgi:hypothetical protein